MYSLTAPHEHQHKNSYSLHDAEEETFTANKYNTKVIDELNTSHFDIPSDHPNVYTDTLSTNSHKHNFWFVANVNKKYIMHLNKTCNSKIMCSKVDSLYLYTYLGKSSLGVLNDVLEK